MGDPKALGHYEILSRLGEGGMGVVYRARDTRLGRTVALKVLPAGLSEDQEREQRFAREARIASSISHPGIATLYDFDHDGEVTFLTMEFIEGPTVRALLKDGSLQQDELLDCGVQVAEALAAAHKQGVVHRDLKPENIMRSRSGHYKVLDFGVARQESVAPDTDPNFTHRPTEAYATRAGMLIGTVSYMSPEQTLGRAIDARSDIFSFGSLLYELATGKHAFGGPNEIAVAQAISFEEPQPLLEARPDLPPGFDAVIGRCLAKKPDRRYQTADDLAQDLRVLRLDSRSGARTTAYRLKALEPARRRHRRRLLAGVAAVIILGALAVLAPRLPGWLGGAGAATDAVAPGRPGARTDVRPSAVPGVPPAVATPLVAAAAGRVEVPRVVVAFFENNSGDPDADWLSRGLPDMLTTDLSRWDGIDVIAPQRLWDLMVTAGRDPAQQMDRSTAAELARWAGASLVITGSVFKAGDQYRIDAQVYDTASGTVAAAHNVVGTALFDMVGDLTAGLRDGLAIGGKRGKGPEAEEILLATTSSTEAYQIYLDGRGLYEILDFTGAAQHFRDALDIDPEFARARLHLATSLMREGDEEQALLIIHETAGEAAAMPEDVRLAAEGLDACFNRADWETCDARFAALTEEYPEEGLAWVWWAQSQAARGKRLKTSMTLRAALDQNPNNLVARVDMARQMVRGGAEPEQAIDVLEQAREQNVEARDRLEKIIVSIGERVEEDAEVE